ncbi:hypothetical protein KDX23_07325 [Burkholderia vietnamiensis]|uniref:hypothetical protein n=1 Tax=Burkholderia vietnamiensis TaxID=60552 RepID=UPI001BA17D62|nr:hypothetical protein [Burkholderia vietnamiensis]MBR8082554.1 hypothetical protein [Burkholderia vietnamiensis]
MIALLKRLVGQVRTAPTSGVAPAPVREYRYPPKPSPFPAHYHARWPDRFEAHYVPDEFGEVHVTYHVHRDVVRRALKKIGPIF